MRDALPELGIAGADRRQHRRGGDGHRGAAGDRGRGQRRRTAAAGRSPGEVLIGETTLALVRGAVEAEPVEPLELKGKAEPVPAYRLVARAGAAGAKPRVALRRPGAELALVQEAWRRASSGAALRAVSRSWATRASASRGWSRRRSTSVDAQVVRGRCLPYGEGITYWPVVEVIKQLDALPSDPAAAAAIRSLLGESDAGTSRGGDRLGVPQAARGAGAARRRLRRHPLGRGDVPRPGRGRRAALLRMRRSCSFAWRRPELVARRNEWPVTLRLGPLPETSRSTS